MSLERIDDIAGSNNNYGMTFLQITNIICQKHDVSHVIEVSMGYQDIIYINLFFNG